MRKIIDVSVWIACSRKYISKTISKFGMNIHGYFPLLSFEFNI